MSEVIGKIVLAVGLAFNLLGCIGLIRLPDIYNRLQAATKCVTMGTCMVLIGAMILTPTGHGALIGKCAVCMAFILITSPTAAHALARGAHAFGIRLWDKSVLDKYAEDREPGVETKESE